MNKQVSVGGHGTLPSPGSFPRGTGALRREHSVCGITRKRDQRERLGGPGSSPQVPFLPPKPCRGPPAWACLPCFVLVGGLPPSTCHSSSLVERLDEDEQLSDCSGGRQGRQGCNYLSWNGTKPQGPTSPSWASPRAHYLQAGPQSHTEITQGCRNCFWRSHTGTRVRCS